MKKFLKIAAFIFPFFLPNYLYADSVYYLDFKYILNESEAGKKAQTALKKKLEDGIKSLNVKEKKLQEEEKKIIQQKRVISQEEYKKKVSELRKKVSELKKERNNILNAVAKDRTKARNELLKNLNPIVKEYMVEKKIRIIIDKKEIIVADEKLDITQEIIKKLNSKIKTIKLK